MTNGWHLALTAAYALPVALLAALWTRRPWRPWAMTLVLLSLPLFYGAHYLSLRGLQGRAVLGALPSEFVLLGERVTEPRPAAGQPGEVLLWVQANGDEATRLHQLPYTKSLHAELAAAAARRQQGHAQQGFAGQSGPGETSGTGVRIRNQPRPRAPPK